ncbi:hypothetical protein I3760_12G059200 [Carya illinoinensis]|nr:hypothetical protein I3760_12G059200 [Carya illinoinensis]
MKLSLKFQDRHRRRHRRHHQKHILLKAKIPISIFNQPFIFTTTATSNFLSDLTFSLSTDFCSGLLKLENCGGKDGVIKSNSIENGGVHSNGGNEFAPERHLTWNNSGKEGFLSGFVAMANTIFPVTKRFVVNLQWGVNFPINARKRMPYLTMNKICIKRIEQVKYAKINNGESNVGDLELLKGLCSWTIRHLEVLEKENREIKQSLEEKRARISVNKYR